jgi:ADP-ribose pyrophosphatase YjhB (NUDIX family)
MRKLFQHTADAPFHISVGALLVNSEGKILVHRMLRERMPDDVVHTIGNLDEAYILMRESLENGETLDQAVRRGLQEEFGAEGEVEKYLGSIQILVHAKTRTFEKTTLYFQVVFTKQNERPLHDAESHTELVWQTPEFLIERMHEQGKTADRADLDESKIIEAYVKYR